MALILADGTGSCTYVPLAVDKVVAAYVKDAASRLILIDLATKSYRELQFPITDLFSDGVRRVSNNSFTVIGSTETAPMALYLLDIRIPSEMKLLKNSTDIAIPTAFFSRPKHISAPRLNSSKDEIKETYTLYLPPKNPNFFSPDATLPPAIMLIHGGPTSHSTPGLSFVTQYWTTRGYALIQVNYVGSSGYGRSYRDALNGNWGISDVEDVASVVDYLVSKAYVNPERIGIVGGSSGGYVALQALCNFPHIWAGGISLYGISGLEALAKTTHKFEAHYMDYLLFGGANNVDEREKEVLLRSRSPCYHAEKINAPTLLLQGSEDKVVPLGQATDMKNSMEANGGAVRLVLFEGEGHGFQKAPNVLKAKWEEEAWWSKTLLRLPRVDMET